MSENGIRVLVLTGPSGGNGVLTALTGAAGDPFVVERAGTVTSCCQRLSRGDVDVVLLDLDVPEAGGLEALRRVRDLGADVPVIAVSRAEDEELEIAAARAGARDYLVSDGLDPRTLRRAVRVAHERRRTEAALVETQRAMAAVLDNLPGLAYRCRNRREWTMEFLSGGCFELTGYRPEELIGDAKVAYADLIHPDDREAVWAGVQAALAEDRPFQLEYRIRTADGQEKWVWEQGIGLRGPDAEVLALEGLIIDVTDRVRAEQASTLLATAVEQGADAILITDPEGRIEYVNPSFERITGYARDEAVGRNPRLLKSGKQDETLYREMWQTIRAGEVWSGELVNRRKDGGLYRQETTISPVRDATGAVVSYVCVGRDVTRERELEEQLRQAQKMEAIGQLAGGVAHDFNNLLTAILGNSEMLLAGMHAEDERRAEVEEIRTAGKRAASLTRQLLAFSRRQVMEPVVLDLNEVVENMSKMIRRLIGEPIELVTRLHPELGSVNADPGQIEQVLLNLAVNARDAMPDGGTLLVETANAELDAEYIRARAPVVPGRYVMIAVTDTGDGMDEATRARIFEPFFTTKAAGQGTGLGLSTVYGIVKQSNGYIWVYSEPGHGTTFKIYLPRVDAKDERERSGEQKAQPAEAATRSVGRGPSEAPAASAGATRPEETAADTRPTVLVVEDDDAVRSVMTRTLRHGGYTVVGAASAEEALRRVEDDDSSIDLLITDLIMSGINGLQLAQQVAQRRPGVHVLYMSGYSDNAVLARGMLSPDLEYLAKPFTQAELLEKVRQIL